jgi:hypothetical protein
MALMVQSGTINAQQAAAGQEFRKLFERSGIRHIRSASIEPSYSPQTRRDVEPAHIDASATLGDAIEALGGYGTPAAKAAVAVLGQGMSVRGWAKTETLPGRKLSEEVARGVLISALAVLDGFFSIGQGEDNE